MDLLSSDSSSEDSDNTEDSFMSTDEGDNSEGPSRTSRAKLASATTLRSSLKTKRLGGDSHETKERKEAKTMRFSSTVHICLVLSRAEMKPLMSELFWKAEEYVRFKHDAVSELRTHLTANGITAKEAIFELYQPHEHERQQWLAETEGTSRAEDTDEDSFSTQSPGDNEALCDIDDTYSSDEDMTCPRNSTVDSKNHMTFKSDNDYKKEIHSANETDYNNSKHPTAKGTSGSTTHHGWAVSWRPKSRLHQ